MLIDTHCHLNYEQFSQYFQEISLNPHHYTTEKLIKRAIENNINKLLFISTNIDDIPLAIQASQQFQSVFCSIGFHPTNIDELFIKNIDHYQRFLQNCLQNRLSVCNTMNATLQQKNSSSSLQHSINNKTNEDDNNVLKIKQNKIIAIGEVGFDLYHDTSNIKHQISAFEMQKEIATKEKLPLLIHSRNSDDLTLANCRHKYSSVIHCFCGDKEFARKTLDLGVYLSFSGIITYKKNQDLRDVVKYVPLDKIFIETDAPFLAPQSNRGKINEPSFLTEIAQIVCECKEISMHQLSLQLDQNWKNVFFNEN